MPDYITLTNGTLQAQIALKGAELRGLSMQNIPFLHDANPNIGIALPPTFSKCRSFKRRKP